jgi:hypothetical protein
LVLLLQQRVFFVIVAAESLSTHWCNEKNSYSYDSYTTAATQLWQCFRSYQLNFKELDYYLGKKINDLRVTYHLFNYWCWYVTCILYLDYGL